MTYIYIDTETTGLDPVRHEVWEIAYAVGNGPIRSNMVPHVGLSAEPISLEVGKYVERGGDNPENWYNNFDAEVQGTIEMLAEQDKAIFVAANPSFDAAHLMNRWGLEKAPWHYRLLDIESYAMGALGYTEPQGMATLAKDLGLDFNGQQHTAAGDVEVLRQAHLKLEGMYASLYARK